MNQVTQLRARCPGRVCPPSALRRERGLTIIELLISVLLASLLIGFVFDIQSRMSTAFRSQTNIGSLQQGIRAANELIARDARLAGFMAPSVIRVSSNFVTGLPGLTPDLVQDDALGNPFVPSLVIHNNPDARPDDAMQPDRIHIFYADPNSAAQTIVTGIASSTSVVVTDASPFKLHDLVLFSRKDPALRHHPLGPDLPMLTDYFTCLVRLTGVDVGASLLTFAADSEPFNTAGNEHCFAGSGDREAAIEVGGTERTQVFRLVARAYRIDTTPSRLPVAALQRSDTAGLLTDWQEIGIGFVDLQISQRYIEEVPDGVDLDGDGDVRAEWYTSDPPPFPILHLTQLGIGLVARSPRSVEGVRASAVPVLTLGNPAIGSRANNPFGDAGGPKTMTFPEYSAGASPGQEGDHVYRQSTTFVDIRNLGNSY